MRLQNTVVTYDGAPYYLYCICDHKDDGIFRVYMEALGGPNGIISQRPFEDFPCSYPDPTQRGKLMDQWMEKHPEEGLIRKHMNSPHFNRFRPFPLGMCNFRGKVFYLERQPQRHTQQGLIQQMIYESPVAVGEKAKARYPAVGYYSPELKDTVLGNFPSVSECIKNLEDPDVTNESVAFHRHFALVRGPVETMFLAYKGDVIGLLPHGDTSSVRITKSFRHTKEVVEELNLFNNIVIK